MNEIPEFSQSFRETLDTLLMWRRDVRRFRDTPVDNADIGEILDAACLSPSVGNSQPWRFVAVDDPVRRQAIEDDFGTANSQALQSYDGDRAKLYASLKLAGLREAPVHLAVFCNEDTSSGDGLGRRTMPEMLQYSAVIAVHTLWLAARARGLGVGWVSILQPENVKRILDVPDPWRLIAYLCIGYPREEHIDPELVRHGWQDADPAARSVLKR